MEKLAEKINKLYGFYLRDSHISGFVELIDRDSKTVLECLLKDESWDQKMLLWAKIHSKK